MVVPDRVPLCFLVWFVAFSSGAFGTWKGCFLAMQELGSLVLLYKQVPPLYQQNPEGRIMGPSLRHGGGHPRPGRIKDPTQLFIRQAVEERVCFEEQDGSAPGLSETVH